jgi:hypothetical protein
MATYAVVENKTVQNIIEAESLEIAELATGATCIDVTEGWDYDNGIDGGMFFEKPEEPVVEAPTNPVK